MISDFFFALRMLGVTILVVIFMQVQIGDHTLDDHFHDWVKKSILVSFMQEAIDGAVAVTRGSYAKAHSGISSALAKITRKHDAKKGESRLGSFKLKRFTDKVESEISEDTVKATSSLKTEPRGQSPPGASKTSF